MSNNRVLPTVPIRPNKRLIAKAPIPLMPTNTPCPSAPTRKISVAKTGIIGIYAIPKKLLKNVIKINIKKILFAVKNLTTPNNPRSSVKRSLESVNLLLELIGFLTCNVITTNTMTKNPADEIRKDTPSPAQVIMNPAKAGAIIRLLIHIVELSATALLIAERSIRLG